MENTEWKPDESLRRIVCAANRFIGEHMDILLLGPRHWDDTMRSQYDQMNTIIPHHKFEQGFLDNFGKWHNRADALAIARKQNQIHRELNYEPTELFSEMLY
jgi:hypothetical protein